MHGGVAKDELKTENVEAVEKRFSKSSERHIENVKEIWFTSCSSC